MIWTLLVIYQLKHWLADYPLQGKYMLGKFKDYPDFVWPLMAHVAVHGVFTYAIAYWVMGGHREAIMLGLFDAMIHFGVDRVKASPEMLGRFKPFTKQDYVNHLMRVKELKEKSFMPHFITDAQLDAATEAHNQLNEELLDWHEKEKSNKYFWWSLGLDQMAHHLTHYFLIFAMLSK